MSSGAIHGRMNGAVNSTSSGRPPGMPAYQRTTYQSTILHWIIYLAWLTRLLEERLVTGPGFACSMHSNKHPTVAHQAKATAADITGRLGHIYLLPLLTLNLHRLKFILSFLT